MPMTVPITPGRPDQGLHATGHPATPPARVSTPAPIVGVAALSTLLTIIATICAIGSPPDAPGQIAFWVIIALAHLFIALGSAKGWQGAQALAVLIGLALTLIGLDIVVATPIIALVSGALDTVGVLVLVTGVLLGSLVLVPVSAREWFAYPR